MFYKLSTTFIYLLLIIIESSDCAMKYKRNPKGPQRQHAIAKCIAQISRNHFLERGLMGITSSFNMTSPTAEIEKFVIERLHTSERWLMQIVNDDDDKPIELRDVENFQHSYIPEDKDWAAKRKNHYYVIVLDNWDRFLFQMPDLIAQQSFNPSASFLIFIHDIFTISEAQRVLEFLWNNECINSILLGPVHKTNMLNIYSLNVFNPATVCFTNISTSIIATCSDGKVTPDNLDLYDDKVPNDSHGCIITAVAMAWPPFVINVYDTTDPGMEIFVTNTIAEHFNFKINYTQSTQDWGNRRNRTWHGLFSKIQKNEADVAVGNIFSSQQIYEDFTVSIPYYEACVHWFVPIAKLLPRWQSLVMIFKWTIWLSLIGTLLAVSLSWYYLAKNTKNATDISLRDIGLCVLNALCVVFGISNPTRQTNQIMRIIFILGSVYGLHINALYQASLMKILRYPPHESQISNLRDLVKSDLQIGGVDRFRVFYNESQEVINKYIFNNYKIKENYTLRQYLEQVTTTGKFATMANKLYTEYYISTSDRSVCTVENCPAVYRFTDTVVCYTINIVARKGFPYMIRIDELLLRFRENGILRKWMKDEMDLMERRRRIVSERPIILTVAHLQGAFILYLFGMVLGCVILMLEKCVKSTEKWKQRKVNVVLKNQKKVYKSTKGEFVSYKTLRKTK